MQAGPFQDHGQGTPRQGSLEDLKSSDVDQDLVLAVQGVECGGACSSQNIWIRIPKKALMVGIPRI